MTATNMCSNFGGKWDSNPFKADNTCFEEDLNQLDMLSLMRLIKGLPTLS